MPREGGQGCVRTKTTHHCLQSLQLQGHEKIRVNVHRWLRRWPVPLILLRYLTGQPLVLIDKTALVNTIITVTLTVQVLYYTSTWCGTSLTGQTFTCKSGVWSATLVQPQHTQMIVYQPQYIYNSLAMKV